MTVKLLSNSSGVKQNGNGFGYSGIRIADIIADHPEQQLKVLNELYRFVTEVTNDCLWEWDLQNKEMFWIDGGHKRVFGYPIENTLIPQSFWEELLHPDDKEDRKSVV